jgi:ABC-type transporter Mla MlaB component
MALGKNMKVDRLIPLKGDKERSSSKESEKKAEPKEELSKVEAASEETSKVSVSLDDFFEALDHPKEEVVEVAPERVEVVVKEDENVLLAPQYEDIEKEGFKLIFKPSRRKTQRRMIITIEGNLTIRNVELLHSKVHDVFSYYDFVEINLANISDVDLTVVQLFHAIRVHFYPLNKFISINADLSREDRKLLNTCGFTEFNT